MIGRTRKAKIRRWFEKHGEGMVYRVGGLPLAVRQAAFRSRRPTGSSAEFIHRFYGRQVWRERGMWTRLELVVAFLFWPLLVLIASFIWTRRNGPGIRRRTGRSIPRQMSEQLRLALAHGALPPWYYTFELYDDEKQARAGEYLHRFETKCGIYPFLKRRAAGAQPWPSIKDKIQFAARCSEHGLPVVASLMVLSKGRLVGGTHLALPETDLFVKLRRGRGGTGARRWDYQGDGLYRDMDGRAIDGTRLFDHLLKLSLKSDRLVQPRLVNNPEIADLSNGVLTTVRILTCRDERGRAEVTNAVFRMAIGDNRVVDNLHAGGIGAAVDIRTGELRRASDLIVGPEIGWREAHPDTGGRILGRTLPNWNDAVALVRRAHDDAFPERLLVGWDVAFLKDGPLLVEGNGSPDVDMHQKLEGGPVGNSRYGQLLAFHIEEMLEQRREDRRSAAAPTGTAPTT